MDILRVTAVWNGFQGAPGYSNFHFTTTGGFFDGGAFGNNAQVAADAGAARVRAAFDEARGQLPTGVTVNIAPEAEVIDSDSGEILGALEVSESPVLGNGGSGGWAAPTGAVVNWRTNDYRFGRRIRGRTFLVPLAGGAYEDDGTLAGLALSDLRAFGTEMVSGTGTVDFGVWSRPRAGTGGVFASVVGSNVPDKAAVLRSRRD